MPSFCQLRYKRFVPKHTHQDVGDGESVAMMEFLGRLEASGLGTWLRESPSLWSFPTVLAFHTFGLALIAGCSVAVDLRILGVASSIPLKPLEKLFPVMWVGFALNATSGVLLFIKSATTVGISGLFWTKIALIAAAMVTLVLIKRRVFSDSFDMSLPAARSARTLALLSILLWTAAITAGRLMAYVGPTASEAGVLIAVQ